VRARFEGSPGVPAERRLALALMISGVTGGIFAASVPGRAEMERHEDESGHIPEQARAYAQT
jgi:hypothetical protein